MGQLTFCTPSFSLLAQFPVDVHKRSEALMGDKELCDTANLMFKALVPHYTKLKMFQLKMRLFESFSDQ